MEIREQGGAPLRPTSHSAFGTPQHDLRVGAKGFTAREAGALTESYGNTLRRGARGGVGDYAAALGKIAFGFVVWFFTGGLVGTGPARARFGAFVLVRVFLVGVVVILVTWGKAHPLLAVGMLSTLFALGLYAFLSRSYARDAMFVAATRDVGGSPPLPSRLVSAPALLAARPLQQLTLAVDRVRRGDVAGTDQALLDLDEAHLAADEHRMLAAVRALRCEALRDRKGASMLALDAFPTGALEVDERLGRICIEGAWHDGVRLGALIASWEAHAIDEHHESRLGELARFAMVRLGRIAPSDLDADARERLLEYARNLGDLATVNLLREAPRSTPGSYR